MSVRAPLLSFFFFNDPATTEIYTLSLHDALPIFPRGECLLLPLPAAFDVSVVRGGVRERRGKFDSDGDERADCHVVRDRKSTRLNSSHSQISYAVFCLKKKKKKKYKNNKTKTTTK